MAYSESDNWWDDQNSQDPATNPTQDPTPAPAPPPPSTGNPLATNPDGSQIGAGIPWDPNTNAPSYNPPGYHWDPNTASFQHDAGAPPPVGPPDNTGQPPLPPAPDPGGSIDRNPIALPPPTKGGDTPPPTGGYMLNSSSGPTSPPNLGDIFGQMNQEAASHPTGQGAPPGVSSSLYNELLARAQQGENVDPNNPNIKQQVDPYSAQVERERRDYLSQVAEARGPMGSIEGERRLSAERAGQATGLFQSQLIGREIQSKRDEIQQALTQLGGQMSTDQQQALAKEMNYLNSSLQKYGIDSGANTALTGIFTNAGLDQQKINSNNDQFADTFGLNSMNQANYWDAIRRGLIRG